MKHQSSSVFLHQSRNKENLTPVAKTFILLSNIAKCEKHLR